MRTTIRMNNELARRAKRHAARTGRTFTQFVEDAVTHLLAQKPAGAARRKKIVLPVAGDPANRMTDREYRELIEKINLEDDLRHIWGARRAAS